MSRPRALFSRRAALVLVCAAIACTPSLAEDSLAPSDLIGAWSGGVVLPTGELEVEVVLDHEADGWAGTIDIPSQGAAGLALAVEHVDGALTMRIRGVPGEPTFRVETTGLEAPIDALEGAFRQGPLATTFALRRGGLAPPPRPQDPKPPFPYRTREVRIPGEVEQVGVLTLPAGDGPYAGVLLVSGSGPQNRDGEVMDHRPFRLWADVLARRGLAVLRLDDRGVGASTGDHDAATTRDFAADAQAALAWLTRQPEIDPERVGAIGHSEGGLIVPMALEAAPDLGAFAVLLAPTAVPGGEVLARQTELLLRAGGAPPALVERERQRIEQTNAMVVSDRTLEELERDLRAFAEEQARASGLIDEAQIADVVELTVRQAASPWYRFFLRHDPAGPLSRLTVPTLVVWGERDLQVDPAQNLPAAATALAAAPTRDLTLRVLPGLNHLLQPAVTGASSEYATIETTIAPDALRAVADWLAERVLGEASGSPNN
ncbi:MAG: alpha/beta fold hydrolase [Acidobacteriota bacterium]